MRIDREAYDRDTRIDHASAAKANLEAAGDEAVDAVLPDKTIAAIKDATSRASDVFWDFRALKYAMIPVAMAWDAIELATKPVLAVKDCVDAAVHGIAAALRKP